MRQPDLNKAILIACPPHQDQYFRPYESHLDGAGLKRLEVATEGGTLVGAVGLADVASSIIAPSTHTQGQVQIAHGFAEPRFAFFLEIKSGPGMCNYGSREIISGFTSHMGIDSQGNLDPQMTFFVNSRITIRDDERPGARGNQLFSTVDQNSHILAKTDISMSSMRPEDIVAKQQVQETYGGTDEVFDARWNLNLNTVASDKYNSMPAHYLSKVVNGFLTAENTLTPMDDTENLYKEAMQNVRTEAFQMSDFLGTMGMTDPSRQHMFTFAELNSCYPRNKDFWQKVLPKPGSRVSSPMETTEHWQGQIVETGLAYSLSHALPALMSKLMLMYLEVDMTNYTLDGQPHVGLIKHVGMFDDIISPQKVQYLIQAIQTDIIRGIILNKAGTFRIVMRVNLMSNSHFDISVNGDNAIPYAAPMYCESYSSPVIGNNDNLNQMAGTVHEIVTRLSCNPNRTDPFGELNGDSSLDYNKSMQDVFSANTPSAPAHQPSIILPPGSTANVPRPPQSTQQPTNNPNTAIPMAPRR